LSIFETFGQTHSSSGLPHFILGHVFHIVNFKFQQLRHLHKQLVQLLLMTEFQLVVLPGSVQGEDAGAVFVGCRLDQAVPFSGEHFEKSLVVLAVLAALALSYSRDLCLKRLIAFGRSRILFSCCRVIFLTLVTICCSTFLAYSLTFSFRLFPDNYLASVPWQNFV
jgi:hypothetical protein